jgi:hypothetical protein
VFLSIQRSTIGNAGRLESLKAMTISYQLIDSSSLRRAGKQ